ncbi:hypothetical protein F5887DRAFT_967574, partial [Amanita rubescens]
RMDGTAMGLRVDVGISDNGGNTGGYAGLTSPALVVSLVLIGLLSLTMFSIFGRRLMYAARRRRRGQGMPGQQTDSETREDHYLILADMLGLGVGPDVGRVRRGMPQLPLLSEKPKLPIAAVVSREETCCGRDATNPASRHITDRCMCCRHRWTPVSEAIQDEQQGRGEEPRGPLPHKSIKVVVAIAMPCPSGQVSRGSGDATMDYSIGVHDIPWDHT